MTDEIVELQPEEPVPEELLVRGIKKFVSIPDEIEAIKARIALLEGK